jgi:hypothetical protein
MLARCPNKSQWLSHSSPLLSISKCGAAHLLLSRGTAVRSPQHCWHELLGLGAGAASGRAGRVHQLLDGCRWHQQELRFGLLGLLDR